MMPEEVRGPVKCVVRNVTEGGKETFAMDMYNRKIRCDNPDFGVTNEPPLNTSIRSQVSANDLGMLNLFLPAEFVEVRQCM